MIRKNKGITLIALVITIIIIIILAGVSISAIMGDNGIAARAKYAAEQYSKEAIKEKIALAALIASTTEGGLTESNIRNILDDEFGTDAYDLVIDPETGNIVITVDDVEFIITPSGEVSESNSNTPVEPGTGPQGPTAVADPANSPSVGSNNPGSSWQSSGEAKLDLGEAINLRLKKIAAIANGVPESTTDTYTAYNTTDTYITAITWSNSAPTAGQIVNYGQLAMTGDSVVGNDTNAYSSKRIVSDVPVYAWYDNGTIYIYSTDSTLQLHPHSERMFEGMTALTDISGIASHLTYATSGNAKLGSLRYMFKDTNISNFSSIVWDVSSVDNELTYISGTGNTAFYKMCNGVPGDSHPTFTNPNGSWDMEGTFTPGVAPSNTLVSKLVALGDSMPSTYGYSVNYSVTVPGTGITYEYDFDDYSFYKTGTENVNVTLNDWKLFYCDGTYAYLISSDTVPNTTILGNETRRIFDADQDSSDAFAYYGNRNFVSGSKLNSSEQIGDTWSSALSNKNNWTQFVNSTYAVEAQGAPSKSMWLSSWNAKYPNYTLSNTRFNQLYTDNAARFENGSSTNGNAVTTTQLLDGLYFLDFSRVGDYASFEHTLGYLLLDKYDDTNIYVVGYTDYAYDSSWNRVPVRRLGYDNKDLSYNDDSESYKMGIRPVIKLKADVLGSIDTTNGTITLGE